MFSEVPRFTVVKTGASKVNDFAPVPTTEETVTRGYPVPPELGFEHRSDDDETQYVAVQAADATDTVDDKSTVEKSRPDMVTTTPPEPAELVPSTWLNTGASNVNFATAPLVSTSMTLTPSSRICQLRAAVSVVPVP